MLPAYAGSTAGFAVVARSHWEAQRAAQAVQVDWRPRPGEAFDSRRAAAQLEEALESGDAHAFHERGDIAQAAVASVRTIEARYSTSHLAHATLEPMNATALVSHARVEVWAPTQVPQMCRAAAARVAGVPIEDVQVHVTLLGGGFGRRLEVDYVAQAVRVAMDMPGVPVQLLWSREEDTTHDFYRPMQAGHLRAFIDSEGRVGLHVRTAGNAVVPRWLERGASSMASPVDLPDKTSSEGLFDQAYGFVHQRVEHVFTRGGAPVGFWRSRGHAQNAFFAETFVDEIAEGLGRDPVDYRRSLLADAPRHLAVLNLAVTRAGWGLVALPPGRARGVALHESFGSIVAQVAEVSLDQGVPRIHRVVCASTVAWQ